MRVFLLILGTLEIFTLSELLKYIAKTRRMPILLDNRRYRVFLQ